MCFHVASVVAHPPPPSSGSCFVRTDQLDGETDWKLRLPVACTQRLPTAAVSHGIKTARRWVSWQDAAVRLVLGRMCEGWQEQTVGSEAMTARPDVHVTALQG